MRGMSPVTMFLTQIDRLSARHLNTGYRSDEICTYRVAPCRHTQDAIAARMRKMPPPMEEPSIIASLCVRDDGHVGKTIGCYRYDSIDIGLTNRFALSREAVGQDY